MSSQKRSAARMSGSGGASTTSVTCSRADAERRCWRPVPAQACGDCGAGDAYSRGAIDHRTARCGSVAACGDGVEDRLATEPVQSELDSQPRWREPLELATRCEQRARPIAEQPGCSVDAVFADVALE